MNLQAIRGDTPVYELTIKRNRIPVNLNSAGTKIQFAAKVVEDDLDVDSVILKIATITDGPNGVCEIRFDAVDTLQFTRDINLFYDIKLSEQGGAITTIGQGTLFVIESVTEGVIV